MPRLRAGIADLDAAISELAAAGIDVTLLDLSSEDEDSRGVRLTGPAGATVDVVQPSAYEDRIRGFIAGAAGLEGPPTDELAQRAIAILGDAWEAIEQLLDGVAHDKVLATMLLLGQRSREDGFADSPAFWQQSAASTLLSGFVSRRVGGS